MFRLISDRGVNPAAVFLANDVGQAEPGLGAHCAAGGLPSGSNRGLASLLFIHFRRIENPLAFHFQAVVGYLSEETALVSLVTRSPADLLDLQ